MAIFRAGKRIGNMDIRVGLPRDKSLDNVEGDKRITVQRPGVNRKTSIGRFITEINKGEGVARANRFLIRLFPPRDTFERKVGTDKDVVLVDKDSLLNESGMKLMVQVEKCHMHMLMDQILSVCLWEISF